MFDEKNQEQVVEETIETSEIQNVEKASAYNASTTTADNVAEIADYLNPESVSYTHLTLPTTPYV